MTTIMIIGAGPLQVPAYIEAHKMGLRSIALDRDPDAPGMKLADNSYVVDTGDADGAIEVARKEKIDGVMTLCTDFPMLTVAAVNEALDLSGLRPKVAAKATHKGLMRDALYEAGVPIPRYRRVILPTELDKAVEDIGFPAVMKPTQSSGSRGIYKLSPKEELVTGIEHVRTVAGESGEILIEEFVIGPEISVETVSFGGQHYIIAITDKMTTASRHWVESGHSIPSELPSKSKSEIVEVTKSALTALGIMDSTAHVEMKVEIHGPKVIEIGARMGGDYITTRLVPLSTGFNMTRSAIELSLGRTPEINIRQSGGAAIKYLFANPGKITKIIGVGEARKQSGVKTVELYFKEGEVLRNVISSADRHGFVIAVGASAREAMDRASAAVDRIIIL